MATHYAQGIAHAVTLAEGTDQVDPLIERVRREVVANPSQQWDLDSLAEIVHLSRSYFCRFFKQRAGITPMAEVRRIRVRAAIDLIGETNLPLRTIAARVGFADEYHLSRSCRRVTGNPPGHFRTR